MGQKTPIDIPSVMTWDLSDVYRGAKDPRLTQDLEAAEGMALEFQAAYLHRLTPHKLDPTTLAQVLTEYEAIHEKGLRPCFFAYLYTAAQAGDPQGVTLLERTRHAWRRILEHLSFFEPGLMALPEEKVNALFDHPRLSAYRRYLRHLMEHRPYRLTEPEERIFRCRKRSGREAFRALFDAGLGSLTATMTVDGEDRQVSVDQLLSFRYSPDMRRRHRAYTLALKTMKDNSLVFTHILNAVVMDHIGECRIRGYGTPMDPSWMVNALDGRSIEVMMAAVDAGYPVAQRYFGLKAEALGMKKMSCADLMAPVGEDPVEIPFSRAKDLLLGWAGQFHPAVRGHIREMFDGRRIDAAIRAGKRPGAFCECFAPSHPVYMAMGYDASLKGLMTLAHELGHAVHYRLAAEQPYLHFRPQPILAEAVAIFFELVFCHYLMQRAEFQNRQSMLRAGCIDEMILCMFRQHALTRFERAVHARRRDHFLSPTEICSIWRRENERLYGPYVAMWPEEDWGWAYIPHFVHHPFYCYTYVVAAAFSLWLFKAYQEDTQGAVKNVIALCRAGGSRPPVNLISELSMDPGQEAFYTQAIGYVDDMITAFSRWTAS